MSDIFISYARADRSRVEPLARALEEQGWSVWWDPHIPAGKLFDDVIEQALKDARCVVVIWSSKSVSSHWVRAESNEGLQRGILVPVQIEDGLSIPLAFRRIQTARLTDWDGSRGHVEFRRLVRDISGLLGAPSPPLPAPNYPQIPKPSIPPFGETHSDVPHVSLWARLYRLWPQVLIASAGAVLLAWLLWSFVINLGQSNLNESYPNKIGQVNKGVVNGAAGPSAFPARVPNQNSQASGPPVAAESGVLRLATWNIYHLGFGGHDSTRTEQDEASIAEVIKKLSPDVLAVEEVFEPNVLERILQRASPERKKYTCRMNPSSGSSAELLNIDTYLNTFLCINDKAVEFVRVATIKGGPSAPRRPFAAVLRHRASGREFIVVVVHLRAGSPNFLDKEDAGIRRQEATALARWLRGEAATVNPDFPKPEHKDSAADGLRVAVLGDFNAGLNDPNLSLAPLALSGWTWDRPLPDKGRYETSIYGSDRLVTDFIMLSPALAAKVKTAPSVYAWDLDPDLGGPGAFHVRADDPNSDLKDYKISDHRPVYADVGL